MQALLSEPPWNNLETPEKPLKKKTWTPPEKNLEPISKNLDAPWKKTWNPLEKDFKKKQPGNRHWKKTTSQDNWAITWMSHISQEEFDLGELYLAKL